MWIPRCLELLGSFADSNLLDFPELVIACIISHINVNVVAQGVLLQLVQYDFVVSALCIYIPLSTTM